MKLVNVNVLHIFEIEYPIIFIYSIISALRITKVRHYLYHLRFPGNPNSRHSSSREKRKDRILQRSKRRSVAILI